MQFIVYDMKDYNRILNEHLKLDIKPFYLRDVIEKV